MAAYRPDRRLVLGLPAGAMLAAASAVDAADAPSSPTTALPPPPVTELLARYAVAARYEDLPDDVRAQGLRTLFNWVGCAIGGSHQVTVDRAVAALGPFSGPPTSNVLGRSERFDALTAALLNGIASHVLDYDDTHLKTIIHPAGPVASAILALAQQRPVSGRDFLTALVLGVEVECRIGLAVYPEHYAAGWHITGTTGPFGSAVACGKLLGLDGRQMTSALAIAASQPVGLKIQFGSDTKSFHPGRAAQNGMVAALLAQQGFTADPHTLEGRDGWGQAISSARRWDVAVGDLGRRYEAALNTYKPFPCGIVAHPALDAAIQLRGAYGLAGAEVVSAELHCNPLVQSLTGKRDPKTGLESKFSVFHGIAVGLLFGAAGERQFSDAMATDPTVARLRDRISLNIDPAVSTETCDLTLRLADGRVVSRHIAHAVGSLEAPMSNGQLEAKFADLADGVLPPDRIRRLMALCWDLERSRDAGAIGVAGAAA